MDKTKEKEDLLVQLEIFKKRNKKLKKKLKSFENIIKETAVAIIIGNKKGEIIEANKKALQLSQYSFKEVLELNVSELFSKNNIPESFSRKDKREPSDEFASEQILQKKNGKKVYVSVKTKLLPDNCYQLIIENIDKRKKAELKLIESEKRYRLLTENIHDVVWTTSPRLKIKYISPSIRKITDYSPDVYYVKPLHELVTPISYQLIRETFRKEMEMLKAGTITASKRSTTLEIKLINKKLNNVWVELIATIDKDNNEQLLGFQGVIRNIDKQKLAQENLAKKEQLYKFALRNTSSGVWELDADLTGIRIDENLLNILGYDSLEIKPLLNEWVNLTVKSDRIAVIDILQDILDGKKATMTYDCRRIHKSGEILWFKDYVEAVPDEKGNIIKLLGTSKNITNEKIIEEKKYIYYAGLQILTDSAIHLLKLPNLEGICDYAAKILLQTIPNSIILFAKLNAEKRTSIPIEVYGINEPVLSNFLDKNKMVVFDNEITLPDKIFNLLEKKTLVEYYGGFHNFINTVFPDDFAKEVNDAFDFANLHLIGLAQQEQLTECILIISRNEIEIRNKEFIEAFINLVSIIINRKNIEDELKNLNKTKDKFFSIISHDLKNPFNTLIGFSGLILQNIDSISREKIQEFVKLIHDGALRSYDMMQNLFDWVVSQKGGIKPRKHEIDAKGLVNSIVKLFSSEAKKKNIDLSLKSSPEIKFYSDIDILNTILRNLVSNALKFTNENGSVEISFKELGNNLQFQVKDSGVGISKELQSTLFDVHQNKSTKGTHNEKGTGLGLILCKEFVDVLGGKIWTESEVGHGTHFFFSIPLS